MAVSSGLCKIYLSVLLFSVHLLKGVNTCFFSLLQVEGGAVIEVNSPIT